MTSENKTIVFDLDDTLANMRKEIKGICDGYFCENIPLKDWNVFNFSEIYTGENNRNYINEILDIIVRDDVLQKLKPENKAQEVTKWFHDHGYYVYILTARLYHPRGYDVTYEWLKNNNFYFDELVLIKQNQSKNNIIRTINPLNFFVDDRQDFLEDALKFSFVENIICINRPWNRNFKPDDERFRRVTSIKQLQEIGENYEQKQQHNQQTKQVS